MAAAIYPYRDQNAPYFTNKYIGYCAKCGGHDVKEGLSTGKCNSCGTTEDKHLYRSRWRKQDLEEFLPKMKPKTQDDAIKAMIADEEKWMASVRKHLADTKENRSTSQNTVASMLGQTLEKKQQGCICKGCGKENDASAKFCIFCGNKMAQPMTCPKCSAEVSNIDKFCMSCGAKL